MSHRALSGQFGPHWHHGGGGSWLAMPHTTGRGGKGGSADYGTDAVSFASPPHSWTHGDVTYLDDAEGGEHSDARKFLSHVGLQPTDFPAHTRRYAPAGRRAVPDPIESSIKRHNEQDAGQPQWKPTTTHNPDQPF